MLREGKVLVYFGFKTSGKRYGRLVVENDFLREIVEAQNGENSSEEFFVSIGMMVAHMKDLLNLMENRV